MRALVVSLVCALTSFVGQCRADQAIPPYSARVVDVTGTLSTGERAILESQLAAFEKSKGSQIAVLIVPSTEPETIEQYGIRVADAWKPGRHNVDDGAILLVAKNDRTIRIEVGRGLEGALTDVASKRIIEDIILPHFRSDDFDGGVRAGVDSILKVVSGEPLPEPETRESPPGEFLVPFIAFFLVAGNVLVSILGRVAGASAIGVLVFLVVWFFVSAGLGALAGLAAFALSFVGFFSMPRGRGGSWSSGGFSSGGSGGGFSGGGGGGFSGGGASGRW